MKCRFDNHETNEVFVDLGFAPPSNAFLNKEDLTKSEEHLPLKVFVCDKCFLVQTEDFTSGREIFEADYVYFSSVSSSWVQHSKDYVEMMIDRFGYDQNSSVMEIASNDGYLLQHFHNKNVPVLGIEPTLGTAEVARGLGIETIVKFFDTELANRLVIERKKFDLILGNNVLAHNPNLNDFVAGMKVALADDGVITMEFPHLYQLMRETQFDTIYHEHFSYFSLFSVSKVFVHHGLQIFDVEEIGTHGGSLRIFAKHAEDASKPISNRVTDLFKKEREAGVLTLDYYRNFQGKVDKIKDEFVSFLIEMKRQGKKVMGYGAAAKGNTLMNYAGIRPDLLPIVADYSPHKQGMYLPGAHIPVVGFDEIKEMKPDYMVVFPWNLLDEITEQHSYAKEWGCKFVTFVPEKRML